MENLLLAFRELHWAIELFLFALIPYLLIVGNAFIGGKVEAPVWYLHNGSNIRFNKLFHRLWTWQRALAFIPIYLAWAAIYHWWAIFGILSTIGIFVFVHDGFYYFFRNMIDGSYPKGFKDTSSTSTAETPTIDWKGRVAFLIVSIMFAFAMLLGKYS